MLLLMTGALTTFAKIGINQARGADKMATTAPWLDDFNSLGLDEAVLAPFDIDYFLNKAIERTNLSNFGNEHFLGPLKIYLEDLQSSELSLIGRMIKSQEILRLLENRLRIEDEITRHPQIINQKVESPIFIVSLPRAGSSILFELMAQKSGIRTTMFWEAIEPCPPPRTSSYQTDSRIKSTEDAIEAWNRIAPEMRSKHLVAPSVPVECIQIQSFSFVSANLMYGTNNYMARLSSDDFIESYKYHRRVLQLLQSETDDKQWLLKAPSHLSNIPELLHVYPDAKIVFMHRDPARVLASTASTMATIHSIFGAPFDQDRYFDFYRDVVQGQLKNLSSLHKDLKNRRAIVDVRYQDLLSAPIDTISQVYSDLGSPLTDTDCQAVGDYLANRPKNKHGHHSYSIPEGIDTQSLRDTYAAYRTQFDIDVDI